MFFYALVTLLGILDLRTMINVFSSALSDFSFYLHATQYFLAGGNPYFAQFPQVYPPAFLIFFLPFALIPLSLSRLLWTTLSILALILTLLILFKSFTPKTKILLLLASFQLFPVKYALAQGQINFFVFLGFILIYHFLSQKKSFLSGLTLALISIAKFNPIIFIIYLFLTRHYQAIISCLAVFLLLNLGIDILTPHSLNLSFWQTTLIRINHPPLYYYNQSFSALLYRLGLPQLSLPLSLVIFTLSIVKILQNRRHSLSSFSLFLVTLLLISPITWQHYLFWTIPAFLYLFSFHPQPQLLLSLLAFILINSNLKNPPIFIGNQLIYSHATLGLLLLYFLLLPKPSSRSLDTPARRR